jgi:hypothetical protein
MGGSERTWGSKGRASWKVTLSSRRWVLYRFGLPHPVLPYFGLVHHPLSRSHVFFFPANHSGLAFAEALAISSIRTCAQSVHLSSPPFFSHANSNFPLSFPIEPSPPASHPCAALDWYIQPAFLSSIPPVIPCFRALPPAPLRPPSVRTRRSSD